MSLLTEQQQRRIRKAPPAGSLREGLESFFSRVSFDGIQSNKAFVTDAFLEALDVQGYVIVPKEASK